MNGFGAEYIGPVTGDVVIRLASKYLPEIRKRDPLAADGIMNMIEANNVSGAANALDAASKKYNLFGGWNSSTGYFTGSLESNFDLRAKDFVEKNKVGLGVTAIAAAVLLWWISKK